jgi:hypothetical protein
MIWLTPLIEKIRADRSVAAREQLVLLAGELSGVCSVHVPDAPAPQYESHPDHETGVGPVGSLCWFWPSWERALCIEHDDGAHATMVLVHGDRSNTVSNPSHEQIRSAVIAFFEGWVSPASQEMKT